MISIEKLMSGKQHDIYAIHKNDRCPVQDFLISLQDSGRKKIIALLKRTAENGTLSNTEKFKKLKGSDLWEFKSYQIRILCAFKDDRIIILSHGFTKKSDKTPRSEIKKAERLLKEYFQGGLWE